jgi:hypothetical protein
VKRQNREQKTVNVNVYTGANTEDGEEAGDTRRRGRPQAFNVCRWVEGAMRGFRQGRVQRSDELVIELVFPRRE